MAIRVEVFKRKRGWYWRVRSRNGKIIAIGGEPFTRVDNARRAYINAAKKMADPNGRG